MELDSPIPEYCPDIARVVRVDCTPFSERCSIDDGKASANGKAVFDILYETDYKNKLKCVSFTQDFSINVNLPRFDLENPTIHCDLDCERISCTLLGPRRVLLKATLGADFQIEGQQSVSALEPKENGKAFFRKKDIEFQGKTVFDSSIHRFDEEINLNQGEKNIGELICGDIDILPGQINLLSGHAEIRTNATLRALYENEDKEGDYHITQKTLPINIDYQNNDIEPDRRISFKLKTQDSSFSPELDQYGESRVIKASFSVKAEMKMNETKSFSVADDMFEKDCDITFTQTTVNIPQLLKESESGFSVEAKLPPAIPKPDIIMESSSETFGVHTEKTPEGVNIIGRFVLNTIAKTPEGVYSFDHTIPFEQSIPFDVPQTEYEVSCSVYPIETVTSLLPDGSINARILAGATISVFGEQKETFISEITKRIPRQVLNDGATLIYCFPDKNENLWDIAKNYSADPEAIAKGNPESFDESGSPTNPESPILIKL